MTNDELLAALRERFPQLGTDEEMNACDTVDALCAWYEEVKERAEDDRTQAESRTCRPPNMCGYCGESPCSPECVKNGWR